VEAAEASQPRLRGFWSLFVTQFQGAVQRQHPAEPRHLSDDRHEPVAESEAHDGGTGERPLRFAVHFVLHGRGLPGGPVSKRTITVGVKVFEIGVMSLVLVGLVWQQLPLLIFTVFLMGTHSAFFGPSKYGLLPELLPEKRLSWGNGLIELGTYMAIILGVQAARRCPNSSMVTRVGRPGADGLGLRGAATSLGITRVPAANPTKKFQANFLGDLMGRLRAVREDRPLALAFAGNTYFSFLGMLLLLNLVFLWHGGAAFDPNQDRLSQHCVVPGNRPGQPGGGLSVRQQDRIRPGAPGALGMSSCRAAVRQRTVVLRRIGLAGAARLCRRFFIVPFPPCSSIGPIGRRRAKCWRRPTCCRS